MRSTLSGAALAFSVLFLISTPAVAESPPSYLLSWGVHGGGDYGFVDLRSVAAEPSGTVLALDGSTGLKRYTNSGTFVQWVATTGTGSTLPHPVDVAAAPTLPLPSTHTQNLDRVPQDITVRGGQLDVAVGDPGVVVVYTLGGGFVRQFSTPLTGEDPLSAAMGIAADPAGGLYILDDVDMLAKKFTDVGALLSDWSGSGAAGGDFTGAERIDVDASGNIYIADAAHDRIQKYGGSSTPAEATTWGRLRSIDRR